jgi:hypothetical protein
MEERIDLLTKELAAKRKSTNFSSNASLILGLLSILLLCGYFGYGYYAMKEMTRPEIIVQSASTWLETYSVEARQAAAEEIRKSAPVWAQEAIKELVANVPAFREKAELAIADYFDRQLSETQDSTKKEFSKIMRNNREEFEEAINLIVESDKPEEFVDTVLPIIEENYATDMRANVSSVLGGLQDFNERLDHLAEGENLNPLEQQQRHILGLTRSWQQ